MAGRTYEVRPVRVDESFTTGIPPERAIINHGYAYLPGLLDRNAVLDVRTQLLEHAAAAGWLADDTDPVEGIPGPVPHNADDMEDVRPVYRQMQATEAFHVLGHDDALTEVVGAVLDEEFVCLPSKVHRLKFPEDDATPTPPHPDWYFLQGSPDCLTAWVPLGDCPVELGGVAVLAGSHRLGLFWSDWTETSADIAWHGGDFQAGDVLLFHSLTVHGALPHASPKLRLSADYRYQPLRDPVPTAWMVPHYDVGGWDRMYRGWSRGDLQRYWEHLPITVTPDREENVERLAGRCRSRLW